MAAFKFSGLTLKIQLGYGEGEMHAEISQDDALKLRKVFVIFDDTDKIAYPRISSFAFPSEIAEAIAAQLHNDGYDEEITILSVFGDTGVTQGGEMSYASLLVLVAASVGGSPRNVIYRYEY